MRTLAMKSNSFLPFILIIALSACSTIEKPIEYHRTTGWSSSNPITIPYRVRQAQFQKNNLVKNPSFEKGRDLSDDAGKAFALDGWQTIGSAVKWVRQESGSVAEKEVNSGNHAVKIVRIRADELDEPEGIISDYIPVIPGNYYFSYSVKFKDVASHKYRLGVQLYDAVVIKVLFFDENKKPIDPRYLNPVSNTLIDNSDKGYSFSNYWQIDAFDWGSVRGRSYNYPFSEGDIPDRTHFVRLFFGLKGTGSMWLDDIEYRYSKWNFTTLERFKPYFSGQLTLEKSIIPTPKSIHKICKIAYCDLTNWKVQLPAIVLPENPAPAERTAADILKKRIVEVSRNAIRTSIQEDIEVRILEKNVALKDISTKRLVFSIGRNELYKKVKPNLPLRSIRDEKQGYIIKAKQVGETQIVFLMGETPLGNYYAATTAIQLFEDNEWVYHNADVIDYPDFLGRSYLFHKWENADDLQYDLEAVERMSLLKLNKVYLGQKQTLKEWIHSDGQYRMAVKTAGQKIRKLGVIKLAAMLNPYTHLGFESPAENLSDQLKYTWTHGSTESLNILKDAYKTALDAGADTIMLRADDFMPHTGKNSQNYSLYTAEDKKRFVNVQNAHAHVINHLKQWIDRDYPGTRLEFCPPWYANEHIDRSDGKAELYFKELVFQIPREIAIIWTGPTIRSLSIDKADLHRFKSLIGRWPMIWDNTLYARNLEWKRYGGYTTYYPGKVRMCNLFEPYDTYRPKDFQKYNHGRQMYTNGAAYSEIYKVKYATVADYEWNTAEYNPESSLWKVLCRSYGLAAAKQLILFNDAYYGLYEMYLRMEIGGIRDEYIKKGKKFLKELNKSLQSLSGVLHEQNRLLLELTEFRDRLDRRFKNVSRTPGLKENQKQSQ